MTLWTVVKWIFGRVSSPRVRRVMLVMGVISGVYLGLMYNQTTRINRMFGGANVPVKGSSEMLWDEAALTITTILGLRIAVLPLVLYYASETPKNLRISKRTAMIVVCGGVQELPLFEAIEQYCPSQKERERLRVLGRVTLFSGMLVMSTIASLLEPVRWLTFIMLVLTWLWELLGPVRRKIPVNRSGLRRYLKIAGIVIGVALMIFLSAAAVYVWRFRYLETSNIDHLPGYTKLTTIVLTPGHTIRLHGLKIAVPAGAIVEENDGQDCLGRPQHARYNAVIQLTGSKPPMTAWTAQAGDCLTKEGLRFVVRSIDPGDLLIHPTSVVLDVYTK